MSHSLIWVAVAVCLVAVGCVLMAVIGYVDPLVRYLWVGGAGCLIISGMVRAKGW